LSNGGGWIVNMGLNLSWIGVQGGQRAVVLDQFGFEEVGEVADEIGADYACAALPNGWLVFVTADRSFEMDGPLAKISSDFFAVGCEMSETGMVSRARAFADGSLLWTVVHDPDKDEQGVIVEGVPPSPFEDIRQRLQAEQAAAGNSDVDYMFDLPTELAASICGYRPGQTRGLEWAVLRKKTPDKSRTPVRRPKSLSAAMKAELLPLLQSLGWHLANDPPSLSDPGEIIRSFGRQEQTLWFDFGSGEETYIIVHFNSWEAISDSSRYAVSGFTRDPSVRLPFWKRFTWKHLRENTRPYAVPDDPVRAAIDKAKGEILAVDTFLKTDTPASCIHVRPAGPVEWRTED
jgi:hypothetical protein